jgi:putative two-component system response regulator
MKESATTLARQPAAGGLHEVLSSDDALATLKAIVRGEQKFDLDVMTRIDGLLRALPDEHATGELVQGLMDVQKVLHLHLLFRQAVPAGLKAVRWARRLGDRSLLGKALTYRGGLAADNYELSIALEATLEALQIGLDIGDANRTTICYLNLALLMRRLGRHRAALACIEAGVESSDKLSEKYLGVRGNAINVLADLQLVQRNWRAAIDAARRAQRAFNNSFSIADAVDMDRSHYASALQIEVCALVHLTDFEGARAVIDRLTLIANQYPSERTEGYLRYARAVCEGFDGSTTKAAETLSDFRHWHQFRDGALQSLIDIYERAGEPGKALEATRELLEGLRSARREVTEADLVQINVASLDDDDGVIRELITRSAGFERQFHLVGDKFNAKLAYLFELAVSAELREEDARYAGEHIYRVGRLGATLASEAGCGEEMCWLAEVAGRAHDVGKTSLPSHTILKIEPLNDGEKDVLRSHAEDGAALVAQLAEPRLVQVVAAVRHHHERWDGAGYPSRLKGEEIPLLARIVTISESFDAMTHSRPFRAARSVASGLQEIERCAGSQFEPRLAGLFVNLVRRLQREHGDLDEYLGEPGRRTRWAKSHPELMRLLEERRTTL